MNALVDLAPHDLEADEGARARAVARNLLPLAARGSRVAANAVSAIERPAFRIRLTTLVGEELGSCPGWVGEGTAVLVEVGDHAGRIVAIPIDGLATRLAYRLELGPRPRRPQPELVLLARDRLDHHLGRGAPVGGPQARADLDLSDEVPDDLAEAIGAMPGKVRRHWRLEIANATDGELVTLIELLDVDGSGYWELAPAADAECVLLLTSSTSLVWSQLAAATARLEDRGRGAS